MLELTRLMWKEKWGWKPQPQAHRPMFTEQLCSAPGGCPGWWKVDTPTASWWMRLCCLVTESSGKPTSRWAGGLCRLLAGLEESSPEGRRIV